MKYPGIVFACLLLSSHSFAKSGDFGVEVDVSTVGLLPPRLETVTVATVKPGSSAAKQGIQPGDKVVSIDGCEIPGCSAFKAKKKMNKKPGETATFEVINQDGEAVSIILTAE
ncbi:PDZ domain-containing protein [Cellvibrio polysaccharolyticus]|uniref:PDZ domain-containing protein n=1 Tax=Cellvibrio polysaccharolyticus TaxID=2082724 RepID=A0A928YU74_9GAMM|nr:PDZ domain-containing protein [Cellvibrio polysaccharolyticus]MBE8717150.1 PDZ domain-containing protein [Cellvibrio polysaccharolyticus]